MEENLKKTFKSINDFADNFAEIKELLEKEQRKNIKLGMKLGKIKNSYSFDKLVSFLKGETTDTYNDYFSTLKPLYDEFGYTLVNKLIIEIGDEETKKEVKENE